MITSLPVYIECVRNVKHVLVLRNLTYSMPVKNL